MIRKPASLLTLLAIPILLFLGLAVLTRYYEHLPENLSQHETLVFGQNRLAPGSRTALRVLVRDSRDAAPLEGAQVMVSLRYPDARAYTRLYSGRTDEQGTADVAFDVPEGPAANAELVVETRSQLGSDRIEQPVTLEREFRVLLTTDKPVYQPGQQIHIRALALSTFDLRPASGSTLEVTVADGKGNKVFRRGLTTSEYGIASVDFQLAGEVNTGQYQITAELGGAESEKTVTVEPYALPKFGVKISTERPYYLPGERVRGELQADYFFGKPVAGGQVLLEGYTFDVQRNLMINLQGTTDESGYFVFEFDLPGYIAGSDLEGGLGRFYLQATIIDETQHSETVDLSLPVSASGLVIEAIPEGGRLRPGLENILYLLASYPDGSPADAALNLTFNNGEQPLAIRTGPYGLAEARFIPPASYQQITIHASDGQGRTVQRDFYFEGELGDESVLLRPDRPIYRVGETAHLTIFTSAPVGTVYLDIVRNGQTLSARSVEVADGHAEVPLDLPADLFGTLELHAYKVLRSGAIVRDSRLIVVEGATDLSLAVVPGADTYRPGNTGSLEIQVNGADGSGTQAALGLAVVDEAVYALAESDPGFARLYFLLEQELLTPKYDLHGFSFPELVDGQPLPAGLELQAVEKAAQASLAAVAERPVHFSLQANSHEETVQRAFRLQEQYFTILGKGMYGLMLLFPALLLGLSLVALWREGHLSSALALTLFLSLAAILAFFFWPLGEMVPFSQTPQDRLNWLVQQVERQGVEAAILVALLGLAGFFTLSLAAWKRRDRTLAASLILLALTFASFTLLVYAVPRGDLDVSTAGAGLSLLALALLPLSILLRASGFAAGKEPVPALAAASLALGLVFCSFPVMTLFSQAASTASAEIMLVANQGLPAAASFEGDALRAFQAGSEVGAAIAVEAEEKVALQQGDIHQKTGADAPHLRQFFPETMLWLPDAVTDGAGHLRVDFQAADSITTWRVSALASSQDGRLGSVSVPLRVFQDFFIDLDLPQALTVGDEVSIPVGVFNYLENPQSLRLELEPAGWFELLDSPIKELEVASNDVSVTYFRVRAIASGHGPFKVTAFGSQMSDAILKEVQVFPNGKKINLTASGRLIPGTPVQEIIRLPENILPGTGTLSVKLYPGVFSQVVEGLDSILRMPSGCFEQTSSTTYPNILVMDYLKTTGQAAPEVQFKAEQYINLGYQRLATFEVPGGGFSLFGDAPADRMLTAYGLQEFADMRRVWEVDAGLIDRAAAWLLSQQLADGSWENDQGLAHEDSWRQLGEDRLPVTAYIAWSLVEAGYGQEPRVQQALAWVAASQAQAEDPYVLALVASALVAADRQQGGAIAPATQAVLDRLASMAVQSEDGAYWQSSVATFLGSEGRTGSIETTALAALVFLRSGQHTDLGNAALTYLIAQKDSFGTWYSTQATVLSLKALLESVRAGDRSANATITVVLDGGQSRSIQVTPENFDVVQLVTFEGPVSPGDHSLEIHTQGEGSMMYQVSGSYYLPWEEVRTPGVDPARQEPVTINVVYDRTELAMNDTVVVNVTVRLHGPGSARQALIDLGVPPGFTPLTEDLEALVARDNSRSPVAGLPSIQRYELTGRQILVYVEHLAGGVPLQFRYRLQARFPLTVQTPPSSAYDYYNPDLAGESLPQQLVVGE